VTHGPVDGECRYGKNPRPARRGLKVSGGRGGETVQLLLASPDGRPRTARLTLSLAPFLFESLTKVIPSHPHLLAAPWFSQIVPLSMSVLSFFLSFFGGTLLIHRYDSRRERERRACIQPGKPFTCVCRGVPPHLFSTTKHGSYLCSQKAPEIRRSNIS
jgi:hypothetical protein